MREDDIAYIAAGSEQKRFGTMNHDSWGNHEKAVTTRKKEHRYDEGLATVAHRQSSCSNQG